MTETKKRKFHPPKFKAKVGFEALGGMKTINQIAQEYDVRPMQVGQCKREIHAQAKSLFEGKCGPQPVTAESAPDRLYGEIARLKMELGWLKKVRDQPAMIRHGWIGAHNNLTQKRQYSLAVACHAPRSTPRESSWCSLRWTKSSSA
jgi:transposase-like protein